MTAHEFLDAKMALSASFRFRETSGFRCREWNADPLIGGAKTSQHQYWLGADIVLWPGENAQAFMKQARRMGVRAVDEGDHIHLQG